MDQSNEAEAVGRQVARGSAWMSLFKLAERSLSLVSITILARLLVPDDFGLVAMAMSMIATLELLSAFSFDMALIQNQKAERRHFDTAWTFNVIFAATSAALLLVLAHPAAAFYRDERLVEIIYLLALGSLLQGLENIGTVEFRKQLYFRREFVFLLLKKLSGVLTTIPLAFLWGNYWALIVGMLTGKVMGVALSYLLHPYRPRFCLRAGRELFRFSGWLMVNNLIFFVKNRTVEFLIGRMLGARALGTYSLSFEVSNMPTSELIAPVNRAVYPGYARLAHDLDKLKESFLTIIGIIALFALPAGAGIAALAEPVVRVLLGENWLGAIPVVSILAFFGSLSAMQSNTTYVFLALGRPQIETFLGVVYVIVLVALLAALAPAGGVIGAAWAYLLTVIIMTPLTLYLLARQLRLRAVLLIAAFWRPALATAVMYVAVRQCLAYSSAMWPALPALLALPIMVALGAVIYLGCVLVLWAVTGRRPGAEKTILAAVGARLKFSRGSGAAPDPSSQRTVDRHAG